jgi:hypothetical protein
MSSFKRFKESVEQLDGQKEGDRLTPIAASHQRQVEQVNQLLREKQALERDLRQVTSSSTGVGQADEQVDVAHK